MPEAPPNNNKKNPSPLALELGSTRCQPGSAKSAFHELQKLPGGDLGTAKSSLGDSLLY